MINSGKMRSAARWVGVVLAILLAASVGFWLRGVFAGTDSSVAEAESSHVHAAEAEAEVKPQVWTCSMHPQIRRYEPGLCPICNMELIPVDDSGSMGDGTPRQLTVSEAAAKLMDVETVPVERKAVTGTVRMVGKVEYDETRLAYITAWIPGRLDRLFIDYTGVPVRRGDHMVSLYSPKLLSAQEELLQAVKTMERVNASSSGLMRETTQSTAKAAREKLRLWGLTTEQIAEIEENGKVSDHMTIYAPTSGIVIHKNAVEGMYVQEGTRIYTIADLSQVWIKLDAYESDLEWLRYGQKVEFTTVAYPGVTFTGTIAFIDPILNERTRTAKVRVNVPNPDGRLKPEMFVKAVVQADIAAGGRVMDATLAGKWICPMHPEVIKSEPGRCDVCEMPLVTTESLGYVSQDPALAAKPLVIPVSAALVTGTRAVVYVQKLSLDPNKPPTFEGREIVLGPRAGDYYLVRSGLEEGELVVVKGNFKIDSALQIMAKPSMMTPEGGGGQAGQVRGESMPQSGEVGALARHQLQQILAAGHQVITAIESEDLDAIRESFAQAGQAIKAVDMNLMTGRAHNSWMELSMALTNDAVEGTHVNTLDEARRIGQSLTTDLEHLRMQMGLEDVSAQERRPVLNEALAKQLAAVYQGYFAMHSALANDDPNEAMTAAADTVTAIKAVDMGLFRGASHETWMEVSRRVDDVLSDAATTSDIKTLREQFYIVSQQLTSLAESVGPAGSDAFYVMHCPMAFDNQGATWLQDDQELQNPYFGAAMLQCGSIEAVIAGDKAENAGDLDD